MNTNQNLLNLFEDNLTLAPLQSERGEILFKNSLSSYAILSQIKLSDGSQSTLSINILDQNNSNYPYVKKSGNITTIIIESQELGNPIIFDTITSSSIEGEVTNQGETLPVKIYTLNGLVPDPNLETWIVIHGFASSPTISNIEILTDAIANENGGNKSQVILLDWSAPADQLLPELAAEWIHDVAEFTVASLKTGWGISASNINLIGHSLGAFISSEIGKVYETNINHLIALDPALNGIILDDLAKLGQDPNDKLTNNKDDILKLFIQATRMVSDKDTYDVDGDTEGIQAPTEFNPVSSFSRAFWGDILKGNGLGSARYAASADESFELFFEQPDIISHHGDIVINYANIILEMGLGEISQRLNLDARSNSDEWQISPEDEGMMAIRSSGIVDESGNDPQAIPDLLAVKNASAPSDDDEIIYGSLEADVIISSDLDDIGSPLFNSLGNDTFYGDDGEDAIADDLGNDIMIGGNNSDSLSSGEGNDTLLGVDPNIAKPGIGEIDTLISGIGEDLLILGDENQAYYNSTLDFNSGLNDYALIADFSTNDDVIQLFGNRDLYDLATSPETLPQGTAIFYKNFEVNELIGIVQGVFNLSLEADYFSFV